VKKAAGVVGLALLAAAAYLLFWPVPAEPKAWDAPTPPGFTGAFAPNTRLANLQRTELGAEHGPEHLVIGPDGKLYAAMTSGNLLRMEPDGSNPQVVASTGGRVLGFAFDAGGRMIAADAMKGLMAITPDGTVSLLTDRVSDGDPIRYANSIVVAPDGTVFFTDASGRFAPADWGGTLEASIYDILEQAATGRVLAYDPATGITRVVAHGFSFANGIALSSDAQWLFVAETGRYRIWKVDAGARDVDVQSGSPQARVLLDNLPGYPDNLMRGLDGRIWAGLFRPRNPAADGLSRKPFIRKVLLRLPRSWLPVGEPYGHVFAFDEEGRVTEDLQDPSGAYPSTTGVTETPERLYIHSLHAPTLGWVPRDGATQQAGLEDIYVFRSIREEVAAPTDGWCVASRAGFEPHAKDIDRSFSFWSVESRPENGKVVNARRQRVAELRGCFGPTEDRAKQNFYAEIRVGELAFQGKGDCLALMINVPEPGLFAVRCQLVLGGLPAPYVGGLLTTNTITSQAGFGGESDPPGYTQTSIATIRLWRAR